MLLLSGVSAAAPTPRPDPPRPSTPNPLAGRVLYVDPDGPARRVGAAPVLADAPQPRWFTEATPTPDVSRAVGAFVGDAEGRRSLPMMVLYAIPHRDCSGFSAGGLADRAAYGEWVRQVRTGIGGRPAVVVLEPDALVSLGCLDEAGRHERYESLRDAVMTLTADPRTTVYVDGGHSRWLTVDELVARLRAVGVERARGFSLNVSNFFTTAEEQAYGEAVAEALGGAHYVVDTSRNGLGPAPDEPLNWCNPPGRALGTAPTTATTAPHADAYLWIKIPGQSDGDCDRGDPRSGEWFSSYAAGLVERGGG